MGYLRQVWSRSKGYRVILTIVVIYAVLRLAAHGVFLAGMVMSGETEGYDLQVYLDAASRLQLQQSLYPTGMFDRIEFYQYSPAYALVFIPFLQLPLAVVMLVLTLLHLVAYGLLYVWWGRIFQRLGLKEACETLARLLPLWLIFSAFWSDLGYLNVYILMALLATLLVDAVLDGRLGWAVLWLSVILQIKPQWAFAAALPLFLGQRRFFFKLVVLTVGAYAAVVGCTMLAVGPSYTWQQYSDYFYLLFKLLRQNYLWRTLADGFLGYNHSITQTVVYLLGVSPGTLRLATIIKALLLLPLAAAGLRHLRHPADRRGGGTPLLSLDLAFALYLGAFIWLEVVWELSLGIALFTYLLATLDRRVARCVAWVVFLLYALTDIWRLFSIALLGPRAMGTGPYFLTDYSVYIPLTMIVILTFYVLLIKRLWLVPEPQVEG